MKILNNSNYCVADPKITGKIEGQQDTSETETKSPTNIQNPLADLETMQTIKSDFRKAYTAMKEQAKSIETKTATSFLMEAEKILGDRGKQYDKPEGERSMGKCVAAFNIITGQFLTEAEGWLLLQILKDVRQWQRPGFHLDSAVDCINYAALKAEAKQHEASLIEQLHQQ